MRSTTSRCSGLSSTLPDLSRWLGIVDPFVLEDVAVDVQLDDELVGPGAAVGLLVDRLDVDLDVAGRLAAQSLADLALHARPLALVEVRQSVVRLAVARQHVEPVRRAA